MLHNKSDGDLLIFWWYTLFWTR